MLRVSCGATNFFGVSCGKIALTGTYKGDCNYATMLLTFYKVVVVVYYIYIDELIPSVSSSGYVIDPE